jgi:hypothetical protein
MKGDVTMTNKSKFIRILGLVASVIGVGASLISDWVNDKKTEEMVDEKVEAALAKREKKEEERPE